MKIPPTNLFTFDFVRLRRGIFLVAGCLALAGRVEAVELNGIVSATQIDPAGGAPINYQNPYFPGTAFTNYCGEAFSPVTASAMQGTAGVRILNFEAGKGFGPATQALDSAGKAFATTTAIAPFVIGNAVTSITAATGESLSLQWRTFDKTILSARSATQGVFLVRDRSQNNTMVSGTQGVVAGSAYQSAAAGGTYLEFDRNLLQFGVVLKCNSSSVIDVIALFDQDGVLLAKYVIGIAAGKSVYFGVKSPSSLIRSVWIGQSAAAPSGAANGLVIDDVAFVPGPAHAVSLNYSFFGSASTAGWSKTSGATLVTSSDHLTIQASNWDSKIYRTIYLPSGTYTIEGTASKKTQAYLLTSWDPGVLRPVECNLTQTSGWRTDHQTFVWPGGNVILVVQVSGASGDADIQSLKITSRTPTPYNYDTAGMASQDPSPAIGRGMNINRMSFTAAPGVAFFNEIKTGTSNNPGGSNVIRLSVEPGGFAKSRNQDFATAWPACLGILEQYVLQANQAGLKVVVVVNDVFTEAGPSDPANWRRDDLNQRFCTVWRDIAQRLLPIKSAIWGYDILNEPLDGSQMPMPPRQWWPLSVNVLRTIRSVDPTTWIVYEVGPGGEFRGFNGLRPLPDTRVQYSAHFYYPLAFTHQGIYGFPLGARYPGTIGGVFYDKAKLAAYLAGADAFVAAWNVPIYVGEFSAAKWGPQPDTANYLADAIDLFEARGWSWNYLAWKSWPGWRLDMDVAYWQDGQPIPPTVPTMTDRGQVVGAGLQKNNN